MRQRFDKGKLSNMFPKQTVVHCKTMQNYRLYTLFADYLPISADQCRLMQMIVNKKRKVPQCHHKTLAEGVVATLHKMVGDVQPATGESLKKGYPRNVSKI